MTHPKKDRNRQASSGRPGTKFMEGLSAPSGEDLKGENWKVAGPRPQDPSKKTEKDQGSGVDPQNIGDRD